MNRVERHIVPNSKPLNDLAFKSKNLYNCATFIMRQNFIHNKKIISYSDMDKILKRDYPNDYRSLPSQTSQQILKLVEKNWKSFFKANQAYKYNPSKFTGRPKLPKYKHKTKGQNIIIFTNQQCKIKNSKIVFPKMVEIEPLQTNITQIQQVRIVPKFKHFIIEVVYKKSIKNNHLNINNVIGIDLGLNNLATLVSNQPDVNPMLINGRPIKSINQFFNKQKAELMSFIGNKGSSNKIGILSLKRANKISDYFHKASRIIIDYAIKTNSGLIIIGENKGWKQEIKIGKRNNQNFVSIPFDDFKKMIAYKAEENGIEVVFTEESYTSKASNLDNDLLPEFDKKKENKPVFSGKRIKRGLYKWSKGILNADLNGALGIIRKVAPESVNSLIQIRSRGIGFKPFRVFSF